MPLALEQETDEGVCVLKLDGELDIATVPGVRAALEPAVERQCGKVVLDLSDVTYADSSALGLLVWLATQMSRYDGKIVLVGANRDVSRVLELSGLLMLSPSFSCSPTVNAALEGLELPPTPAGEPVWEKDLDMRASVDELSHARERVVEALSSLDLSEAALYDLKVGVGEALANAVLHGSPRGELDTVHVEVVAYDDRVSVCVVDSGEGLAKPLEERGADAIGGRGLRVMRAFLDQVSISEEPDDGTRVTLIKHLRRS